MGVALKPGETGREWMDRRLKEIAAAAKAEAEVRCTECWYVFDAEDMADVTTYFYGGAGPQDVECPGCDAVLLVTETVTRTYEVELA